MAGFFDGAGGSIISSALTLGGNYLLAENADSNARSREGDNFMNSLAAYANRYRITMDDMRRAGLNPILAASGGFNVGNPPSVGAVSSPAGGGFTAQTLSSSARDYAETDKAEKSLEVSDQEIAESKQRIEKMGAEISKMGAEISNMAVEARKMEQEIETSASQAALNQASEQREDAETLAAVERAKNLAKDTELKLKEMDSLAKRIQAQTEEITKLQLEQNQVRAATKTLEAERAMLYKKRDELEQLAKNLESEGVQLKTRSEVYKGTGGKILTWATEIGRALSGPLASGAAAYGGAKLGKGGAGGNGKYSGNVTGSFTVPRRVGDR